MREHAMTRAKVKSVLLRALTSAGYTWCRAHHRYGIDCRYHAYPGQEKCVLDATVNGCPWALESSLPTTHEIP